MNGLRFHRHFYSTPHYAPFDHAPGMFAVKPLHVGSRMRGRGHFGGARTSLVAKRRAHDASSVERSGRDVLEQPD